MLQTSPNSKDPRAAGRAHPHPEAWHACGHSSLRLSSPFNTFHKSQNFWGCFKPDKCRTASRRGTSQCPQRSAAGWGQQGQAGRASRRNRKRFSFSSTMPAVAVVSRGVPRCAVLACSRHHSMLAAEPRPLQALLRGTNLILRVFSGLAPWLCPPAAGCAVSARWERRAL